MVRLVFILLIALLGAAPTRLQAQGSVCAGKSSYPSGSASYTLEFGGHERVYRLFVPSGYHPQQAVPLVMTLHGAGGWAAQQEEYSGWNEIAERETFLTVHPQGWLPTGPGFRWNAGEPMRPNSPLLRALLDPDQEQPDDAAFLAALLAHVQDELCVDAARVYVNGLSNGGGMTYHIACVLADTIAAVGTVAGAYTPIPGGCEPERSVPVVSFHGTADRIVPYQGSDRIGLAAIEQWISEWAARNGCDPAPKALDPVSNTVSVIQYVGCQGDADVVLYTIDGGGHTWPGSEPLLPLLLGSTTQDIDATEVMWAFFTAHPLR